MSEIDVLRAQQEMILRDMRDMKVLVGKLIDVTSELAVVHERQINHSTALDRVFGELKELKAQFEALARAVPDRLNDRLMDLEVGQPPELTKRLSALETSVPEQKRVNGWVTGGISAGATAAVMFVAKKAGLL